MMNRGYTGKQLRGGSGGGKGLNVDKQKREASPGSAPASNVQGSGKRSGLPGAKNAMSSHEGSTAQCGGHVMGKHSGRKY
jgi:hypothetical protein